MKIKTNFILTLILTFTFSFTAYPHSGRTDSNGGHKDNKNASGLGSYHYHHGYSAHLHPNGVCLYASSGSSTNVVTPPIATETPVTAETPPLAVPATPNLDIKVFVSSEEISFSEPPTIINGRVMVPIRSVVEKIGCHVEWDSHTQTVYINTAHTPLNPCAKLRDNINVYVDNEQIIFDDQHPVNINGTTLLPIRFVTEKLGYTVSWDGESQTVTIDEN